MNPILPFVLTVVIAMSVTQAFAAEDTAPQTVSGLRAGNMIIWDPADASWCDENINTGSKVRELAAQDADVLRSFAATLMVAQADMSFTLTNNAQSDWLYTNYGEALGNLVDMNLELAREIAWLDDLVLSFDDSDEVLTGRQLHRAQRLCTDQDERLNRWSGLWADTMAAAAIITDARQNARVNVLPWRTNPFMADDIMIVRHQIASLTDCIDLPECLDDLDRRLGGCVDK